MPLGAVAIFLAYQSRKLLPGESADRTTVHRIHTLAEQDPDVVAVKKPYTMHVGPGEILLNLDINFNEG